MSQSALVIAGCLLAAATVLLGLGLARRAAVATPARLPAGLLHGGLGLATALVVGAAAFAGYTLRLVNAALLFFAFALIGGLFVLLFRLQRQPPPLFMVALHGASGVLALLLMGLALVRYT